MSRVAVLSLLKTGSQKNLQSFDEIYLFFLSPTNLQCFNVLQRMMSLSTSWVQKGLVRQNVQHKILFRRTAESNPRDTSRVNPHQSQEFPCLFYKRVGRQAWDLVHKDERFRHRNSSPTNKRGQTRGANWCEVATGAAARHGATAAASSKELKLPWTPPQKELGETRTWS